jgi:hypothetical protein
MSEGATPSPVSALTAWSTDPENSCSPARWSTACRCSTRSAALTCSIGSIGKSRRTWSRSADGSSGHSISRARPFHFEFFRQPSGELAALEVNMRQPGGLTVDMWNWANDIDFYRAWADTLVHGTASVATRRPYYCLWSGRKTGKAYRLSHDELIARFGRLLVHHERVDDVFSAAIGNFGYILRDPSLEPLLAANAEIEALAPSTAS